MNKINQVLQDFIEALYREGKVKQANWEVLLPVPWGERYAEYSLTQKEAKCLRLIMLARAEAPDALFDFNAEHKCWHLDLYHYARKAKALEYLIAHPVESNEWQAVEKQYLEAEKERKYRQRA